MSGAGLLLYAAKAGMEYSAGKKAKKQAGIVADMTLASGIRQAGLLTEYAGRQEEYAGLQEEYAGRYDVYSMRAEDALIRQAGLKYKYATAAADLEEQEIPLLMLSIERQVAEEERAATDREIGRRRRLNQALGSQAALRTAQGIQAYDGSPLAMMGADIAEFDYDQAIDKGETARRIVDARFFGSERVKLMAQRVSLLRYGAETEYTTGLDHAALQADQISLQAESIRLAAEGTMIAAAGTHMSAASKLDASQLEAEAIRIQGGQAKTAATISAANTLLTAADRYSKLGG
jgi:hypothetical protein